MTDHDNTCPAQTCVGSSDPAVPAVIELADHWSQQIGLMRKAHADVGVESSWEGGPWLLSQHVPIYTYVFIRHRHSLANVPLIGLQSF